MLLEGESFLTSLNLGLAIMMWMYSGWESMSTLAGEIQNPQKVIPKALMIGTPLVIATYFVTVWAAIRIANVAGPDNYLNMWTGGGGQDFVVLAKVAGGTFFGYLMLMSAILSNIGLYAGYLATGAQAAVPDVARPAAAEVPRRAPTRAGARRGRPSFSWPS